uniref:hypothetical protein n=2 Tax=Cylindrospermopsis raciborskii TaxID=77022 RepID=UPI001F24ED9A|nr:hypothetical protein [Cylindrospermopsis raciborskii]
MSGIKRKMNVGWVEERNPTNQQDIYKCDFEAHPCHYILLNKTTVIVAWVAREGSQRQLAERFKVSLSFVKNLVRRYSDR